MSCLICTGTSLYEWLGFISRCSDEPTGWPAQGIMVRFLIEARRPNRLCSPRSLLFSAVLSARVNGRYMKLSPLTSIYSDAWSCTSTVSYAFLAFTRKTLLLPASVCWVNNFKNFEETVRGRLKASCELEGEGKGSVVVVLGCALHKL